MLRNRTGQLHGRSCPVFFCDYTAFYRAYRDVLDVCNLMVLESQYMHKEWFPMEFVAFFYYAVYLSYEVIILCAAGCECAVIAGRYDVFFVIAGWCLVAYHMVAVYDIR